MYGLTIGDAILLLGVWIAVGYLFWLVVRKLIR